MSSTRLVGDLQVTRVSSKIASTRQWSLTKRFFLSAVDALEADSMKGVAQLLRDCPHWMHHTQATHALEGAELTAVRDNLRHASVSNTSVYLHTDPIAQARWGVEVKLFRLAT